MRICFLGTDTRLEYLRGFASTGVTLDNMTDFEGSVPRPSSVESRGEELALALWVIEQAVEAERRGFDAVITGCFSDPGVEAARERVVIPVIGPGETALYTARMLAHYFSVVTPLPETVPLAREQAHRTGMHPFIASIVSFDLSVEAIRDRDPATISRLIDVCRACVRDDGAEAIVCGCASMSLLSDEIGAAVGVPVLNSVRLSLRAAEMMVGSGLCHSKKTFPVPLKQL